MENIQILVDASGSALPKEYERQLAIMKKENNANRNIEVSFYSHGITLQKNLNDLNIPISDEESKKFGAGGDNIDDLLDCLAEKKPDVIVFIGDFIDRPIKRQTINSDISYLFICTVKIEQLEKNFLCNMTGLPNVKWTSTFSYISLSADLPEEQPKTVLNKISELRKNAEADTPDSKAKPK